MADMFRPVPVDQEPKRKNRFTLEFPTELGIESYNVQTSGKPTITINSTEIPYMNTSTWVAGRFKWEPIDIEFIDVIGLKEHLSPTRANGLVSMITKMKTDALAFIK